MVVDRPTLHKLLNNHSSRLHPDSNTYSALSVSALKETSVSFRTEFESRWLFRLARCSTPVATEQQELGDSLLTPLAVPRA